MRFFLEGKTGWRQIGRKKERKRIEYFSVNFKREGGGGGTQFSLLGELERRGILVSRKANVMVRESSVPTTQQTFQVIWACPDIFGLFFPANFYSNPVLLYYTKFICHMADYQLNYPVTVRFCVATWWIFCPWRYRPSFEKRSQMLPLYPFPPVPKTRFSRQTQIQEESIKGEKERWIYRISPHSKHGRGKGQFKLGGGPKPFWAWLKTDRQTDRDFRIFCIWASLDESVGFIPKWAFLFPSSYSRRILIP